MADIDTAPERNISGDVGGLAHVVADRNLVIVAWGTWNDSEFDDIIIQYMAHEARVDDWQYHVLPNGMELWVIALGGEHAHA